jgi:mRNA-degrading endonuclease RelE of RelBE toxin-antitoxin system
MYRIEIESIAQKVLKKLPHPDKERIAKSIADLAINPRPWM